jgi:cell division protein FtsL
MLCPSYELEIEMTDWADGIETRNYGIKSEIDAGMLSELLRNIVPLALIAGALLFCAWVRSQIVYTGYESQRLFAAEQLLLRDQKNLRLEENTLINPKQIDLIARNELGMVPLRPNQFIVPQGQETERGLSNTLAMVDSEAPLLKVVRNSEFIPAN